MDPLPADLLDALPDGVVLADAAGRVSGVNAAAVRLLGGCVRDHVGSPLDDVLRLQNSEGCTWTGYNTPYAGLRSRVGVPEQSWLLPSGLEVLTTARIERDAAGAVARVAVTLRSGRGRERLDRERSDLVATVAHELRSPLTGVKGFVQAMLNRWEVLSDEQKRLMLTTVNADADRLSRLITELLDVARIDTGRLALYPRPVDAATIAARVVASVATSTSRPIALDAAEDLPPALADPDKLTQVLTNLVENGVRHGDGTVRLSLGVEGEQLVLGVEDEGSGIPEEIRRRVFTKFWHFGTAGGSGLGLYIVSGLVGAHGGTVSIGETEAGGALLVVRWPVATSPLGA
ncbi:ATP-binding protein [Nocardioides zeae]|uniref:histidine kinase n=1 Tax=Nocardioides imazamoxiresistens TaxID=3231893 RepID=A0ABU3PZU9_9ACTN|nr:ATP-binding protein [Nocardioides zeae]MDT9594674.1 ATP-binding protein [Nocardioides zeae]